MPSMFQFIFCVYMLVLYQYITITSIGPNKFFIFMIEFLFCIYILANSDPAHMQTIKFALKQVYWHGPYTGTFFIYQYLNLSPLDNELCFQIHVNA